MPRSRFAVSGLRMLLVNEKKIRNLRCEWSAEHHRHSLGTAALDELIVGDISKDMLAGFSSTISPHPFFRGIWTQASLRVNVLYTTGATGRRNHSSPSVSADIVNNSNPGRKK